MEEAGIRPWKSRVIEWNSLISSLRTSPLFLWKFPLSGVTDRALPTLHCPLSTRPLSLAVSCSSLPLCLPLLLYRRHQGARALHAADGGGHVQHQCSRYDGTFFFWLRTSPLSFWNIPFFGVTDNALPTLFSTSLPRCLMPLSSFVLATANAQATSRRSRSARS